MPNNGVPVLTTHFSWHLPDKSIELAEINVKENNFIGVSLPLVYVAVSVIWVFVALTAGVSAETLIFVVGYLVLRKSL